MTHLGPVASAAVLVAPIAAAAVVACWQSRGQTGRRRHRRAHRRARTITLPRPRTTEKDDSR